MFILTNLQKGGLNHKIFLFLFFLTIYLNITIISDSLLLYKKKKLLFTLLEFFTSVLADGFSLEFE